MSERPHLLIVDDDREIRGLLAQYLEKHDFRTTTVADGREMRRILERSHVDLLVLDLMLPGEDGLSLCRELRSRSQLPIIMLTARDTVSSRQPPKEKPRTLSGLGSRGACAERRSTALMRPRSSRGLKGLAT